MHYREGDWKHAPVVNPVPHHVSVDLSAAPSPAEQQEAIDGIGSSPGQQQHCPHITQSEIDRILANQPQVRISPIPKLPKPLPEFFDLDDDAWKTHPNPTAELSPRPRPSYADAFMEKVSRCFTMEVDSDVLDNTLSIAVDEMVAQGKTNYMALTITCATLAYMAQKDMSWKQALASDRSKDVITASQSEKDSLGRILTKIYPHDPKYQQALDESVSGRYLLDERRSGQMKVRGVKQGCKEDKLLADGPDFTYYSHTVRLNSVRAMLFRKDRGMRRLSIKDVSTAFLQSHKYPDGMVKFVHFKDPVLNEVEYFEQSGPIYGKASAVRR